MNNNTGYGRPCYLLDISYTFASMNNGILSLRFGSVCLLVLQCTQALNGVRIYTPYDIG